MSQIFLLPRRDPLIRPQPVPAPNYFAQLRSAGREQECLHRELRAAGFEWDGQDGYLAPGVGQ